MNVFGIGFIIGFVVGFGAFMWLMIVSAKHEIAEEKEE